MLNSKFDLYKQEWLELVFEKRNKEYGAYYLRQHYADTMIRVMGVTFSFILIAAITSGIIIRSDTTVPLIKSTDVVLSRYSQPIVIPPKKEIHQTKPQAAKPVPPVTMQKFVPPVVTSEPITAEPPKISELTGPIGQENVKVPGTDGQANLDANAGKGTGEEGIGKGMDNGVHTTAGLEVMPEPYGGATAWAKFLHKNLKYPYEAFDKSKEGNVWVSFIIEKDGRLSSLVVEHGAGFGMDEEALRVLKLAPAWKPGIQNGQPVRVKYTLPLSFQLGNN
jgi:protein TonB